MKKAVFPQDSLAQSMTVVVADDHLLVRDGVKMLVTRALTNVNFLEAHDGDSLLQVTNSCPVIGLALVDLKMPGMQGGLRIVELAREHPSIPLVIISALSSPDIVRRVMEIPSVYAFVPKSGNAGSVRVAIEAALQGKKLPFANINHNHAIADTALTPRQQEIRDLLREGLSNKLIAGALGISEGTVKNHITEIFKLLNATNRTQAAQLNFEAE